MMQTTRRSPLQSQPGAPSSRGDRIRSATAGGTLHGATLVAARALWLVLAAITFALFAASTANWLRQMRGPCPPDLCVHGQVSRTFVRALADLHLSVSFYAWYQLWITVLFAVGFVAVAILLFSRRSSDPLALFVSLALLLFGVVSFDFGPITRLAAENPSWLVPVELLEFLGAFAFTMIPFVFPDGRFVPRWAYLSVVPVVLWFLPVYLWPNSPFSFATWPGLAALAGWACLLGVAIAAQVYRYRRVSTPVQRQQTKWVVYGIVAGCAGFFVGRFVYTLLGTPPLTTSTAVVANFASGTLIHAGMLLVPVCTGIAILRSHLFDIDVIIRRTLVYGMVIGVLAAVYFAGVVVLQTGFRAVTGQNSAVALVISTLAIAALFQPLRGRVRADVDRRFYRHKYDAARTLEAFGATLRSEVDMTRLGEKVMAVVEETMQPSIVSLWLVRTVRPGDESGVWQRTDMVREGEPVPRVVALVPSAEPHPQPPSLGGKGS